MDAWGVAVVAVVAWCWGMVCARLFFEGWASSTYKRAGVVLDQAKKMNEAALERYDRAAAILRRAERRYREEAADE